MIEFIPAHQLKKEFDVFGHFYSIKININTEIDCRSILEIINKNVNHKECSSMLPDAIFIMMNPGSSKPLDNNYKIKPCNNVGSLQISLIPTKPDTTQYQIMRVMRVQEWSYVRILNLSDMRDPKSGKFIERFREIESQTGFEGHSIFADIRNNELNTKLKRKKASPVIRSWGVSTDLDPLIERCENKILEITDKTGLLKEGTINKYFHPLPTLQKNKEKWVNDMVNKLKYNKVSQH
jgi:hypothetical protein